MEAPKGHSINIEELETNYQNVKNVLSKIKQIEKSGIKGVDSLSTEGKTEEELEQMRQQLTSEIDSLKLLSSEEITSGIESINTLFEMFELFGKDLSLFQEFYNKK